MKYDIVLTVINDLVTDQRVHRTAQAFHEAGLRVLVIGRLLPDSKELNREYAVQRMKLKFIKGKLFYLEYTIKLFWKLISIQSKIFYANDLDTLLPVFIISKLKKRKLIYDTHEYFTQVPELLKRPFTRLIWETLESFLFPKVKTIITVNEAIASEYEAKYKKKVQIVMNLPSALNLVYDSESIEKRFYSKIIIYQGAVNMGRGIELMIDTMEYLPEFTLWIIGTGDLYQELTHKSNQKYWNSRIIFRGQIPFELLKDITCQATLGLSLEEDLGLNYRLSTPNKVFDYVQSYVPVIGSNLPMIKRIITENEIGLILNDRNPKELANLISSINLNEYKKLTESCYGAAQKLVWQKEKMKLYNLLGIKAPI